MLYEAILKPYCPKLDRGDSEAVLKCIFPEKLFDYLFFRTTSYNKALIDDVYYGRDDAKKTFTSMRDLVLEEKINGHAYDINSFPYVEQFQSRWEECIPLLSVLDEDGGQDNPVVKKLANDIATLIDNVFREEPTNLEGHLLELFDDNKWALLLAKLSIIATSLSCFCTKSKVYSKKNREFHATFLPEPKKAIGKEKLNQVKYDILKSNQIQLTWKKLHDEIMKKLNPDPRYQEHLKFLEGVMPGELFRETCCTKEGIPDAKHVSCVYYGKNGAETRFNRAKKYLINKKSKITGEPYTWDTLPIIVDFKAKWEELIPTTRYTALEANSSEDPAVKEMQNVIEELLKNIPADDLNVAVRIRGITKSEPYSMAVAILSVIASTLFCFPGEKENTVVDDMILYDLVLPPIPEKESSPALQKFWEMLDNHRKSLPDLEDELKLLLKDPVEMGEANFLLYQKAVKEGNVAKADTYLENASKAGYLPASRIFNNNIAMHLLDDAGKIFQLKISVPGFDEQDKECCSKCEMILCMPTYISPKCRADASYMLYKYISSDNDKKYTPSTGETAEYYLEISHMYGHELATEEWEKGNASSITPHINKSDCSTKGICYHNVDNDFSKTFEKTIPDTWGSKLVFYNLSELEKDLFSPIQRRFLFASDDFSENLGDLLQTLQLVKKHHPKPEELHWEFFVRHDSESIHSLVDTALSRLSEYKIPVYILNDSKIAAQQLLSQHPLFYPVRELKLDKIEQTGDQRPLLHFVVLGNSTVTEWLVREAFWMMGFRGNAIRSRITVLAENGKSFEVSLKGRFPGMSKDIIKIDGIELPEINGEDVILESVKLQDRIQSFTRETDYCYFAIATDSDENNLTLATRVREMLIRSAFESKKTQVLNRMPPVAFLCKNEKIAWISKHMVVEAEKYGDSWYNNRALIPFGQISERYSFGSITGGTFEALAKCIHYQYNQLVPVWSLCDSQKAEEEERTLAAEKDYYIRQYNQDSSYSMALGMPYRLFQFHDSFNNQLTPPGWNILQSSSFSSANQLHILANRIKIPANKDKEEIQKIAEWEHARWVRWMLSRGWKTATADEAVFAFQCGNPRQQLFACKMHPCICSYDALEGLSERLRIDCKLNKDFYSYDYWNIEATKQLLDLEWVDKTKEAPQKTIDVER